MLVNNARTGVIHVYPHIKDEITTQHWDILHFQQRELVNTSEVETSAHSHHSRGSHCKHVPSVCYLVSTDDHQSAAAVLCPAGQELSLLL